MLQVCMSVTNLKVLKTQLTARRLVPLQACNHGTMVDAAWNGTRSIRTCKSSATQIVQHSFPNMAQQISFNIISGTTSWCWAK